MKSTLVIFIAFCLLVGLTSNRPAADQETKVRDNEWLFSRALNHVSSSPNGIAIAHPSYAIDFTTNGVKLNPKSGAPSWSWTNSDTESITPVYDDINHKVVYNHSAWREEYVLKSNSIEQQFVIDEPQQGSIRIVGQIASDGEFISSKKGWQWKNDNGEVYVGHVTAFDSNGTLVAANMTVTNNQSVIEISESDLKSVSYPLTIDPEIGTNDFRVSAVGSDGDAVNYTAGNPAVAHIAVASAQYPNGVYLVVFEGSYSGEFEIYGQFIDGKTGALIDVNSDPLRTDFQISNMNNSSNANFDANKPDVVATNGEFFVVWHGDDTFDNEYEIYGQRIDGSAANLGTKLGSQIRISHMGTDNSIAGVAFEPSVAFNSNVNDKYLVTWYGYNSGSKYEIFSQLVGVDGTVPGGGPTTVSAMAFNAYSPRVAFNKFRGEYMVTWFGDNAVANELEIYVHRVAATGGEVGNDVVISDMGPAGNISYAAQYPSIAYGPSDNFLVVWQGDDNTAPLVDEENEIFGQLVTGTATETGADFRISNMGPDGNPNYDALLPRVVYDSYFAQYVVTWHGDNNVGGLIDNENEVYEQIVSTAGGQVGGDVRLSNVGGSGNTTYGATNCALTYNTLRYEAFVNWRGNNNTVVGMATNEIEIWGQRFAEKKSEPSSSVTSTAANTITPSSFNVTFTAAAADGYVVIRKSASAFVVTDTLADQTTYSPGDVVGTGSVVYAGSTAGFSQSSLTAATDYNFRIFSYNGAEAAINYKNVPPATLTVTTLAVEPTTQPTSLTISAPTISSLNVAFTTASGSPAGYLVLRKAGSAPTDLPADGTSYTAGNTIGSSAVVNVGSGTSFSDAGLSSNTIYFYQVFSYNGSGASLNYLTTSPLSNNRTTLTSQPTSQPTVPVFNSVTSSSYDGSFTTAAGTPSGYIALRKLGSAPTEVPVDGSTYSVGATIGTSGVAFVGSATAFSESGLISSTQYFYQIFSYNGSGANTNYLTTSPLGANKFTLAADPSAQPTSLTFPAITTGSLGLSWTAASGSPTGYVVLRRAGSASTDLPSDATVYSVGNTIGASAVAFVGSATSFTDGSLSTNTVYHYAIFSYNGSSVSTNYLASSPLINNHSTLQTLPTNQPTTLTFNSVTSTSMNGSFTTATGAPSGYIVLRKAGSSSTDIPVSGTTYSVGAVIGASTVVASGSATTFASSSLSPGVTYFYDVLSFNGSGGAINYLTASPLEGSQVTTLTEPTNQPSGLTFSSITPTSAQGQFATAVGNPAGYLVLRKSGSSPTEVPVDGTTYSVGNSLGTSLIVSFGSSITFTSPGMSPATGYFYDIFSFNGAAGTYNYLSTSPLEGSHLTLSNEPTAQPTSPVFSSFTTTSYTFGFSAATGSPTGYLVIRKTGSAPSGVPVDGTVYSAGNAIGDATVVSSGSGLSLNESSLTSGTTYFYKVFSFNGSASTINYFTTSPLSASTITICAPPSSFNTTSNISQTGFTLSWPSVTGADSYKLEISSDNFASFVSGYAPKSIAANPTPTDVVTGLQPGITYKFRVRAVNASGESANTQSQQITIPATPVIGSIDGLTQTGFNLPWNAIAGTDQYLLDISTNNAFTSFVTGFESKVVNPPFAVTGLAPGVIYFLRLRSSNSAGTSASSSTVSQETKPATPIPFSVLSEDISSSSFKAKWNDAVGATSYEIEVSKDDFVTLISPYNPKAITDGLEITVDGLDAKTSYKFRLRARSGVGYSTYSSSIVAETKESGVVAQFKINTAPSSGIFGAVSITVNVTGADGACTVLIHHRPILTNDFVVEDISASKSGDNYTFTPTEAMLDDFGMEYFFTASDSKGNNATPQSTHSYLYKGLNSNALPEIPNLSAGGQIENYRIISIPYQLEDNLVQAIFGVLGDYDPTKWRLIHYQNGKNVDYPTFNRILPGVGYWFNSVDAVSIKIGDGSVQQVNQSTPFKLNLAKGWNQIGNPYPFDINWTAVQQANAATVGNFYSFNSSSGLLEESSSSTLKVWSGGFVFADADINGLEFPVDLKSSGRMANINAIESQSLDAAEWKVKLSLKQGGSENNHIAFGMHPDASKTKDRFDEIEVPRFFHYLEMATEHKDFFAPHFSNDVVPTQNSYQWEFTVSSDIHDNSSLQWSPEAFGNNDAQLWLYDESSQMLIDMRKANRYDFELKGTRLFKITYAISEHDWIPDFTFMGQPWPNPSAGLVNIPVLMKDDSEVTMDVIDMSGKKIRTLVNGALSIGLHTIEWSGDPGFYLVRMKTSAGDLQVRKLIIK